MLRLKDDLDESEKVKEKNLQSKLEAAKKKTLDKAVLEQTLSELEVLFNVAGLGIFKLVK